jgi:hypothetical protein
MPMVYQFLVATFQEIVVGHSQTVFQTAQTAGRIVSEKGATKFTTVLAMISSMVKAAETSSLLALTNIMEAMIPMKFFTTRQHLD